MPRIELKTEINADINVVFDLSRSIDLHKLSMAHTNETAIGGKMSGLIELNESVTFRTKHFGIYQQLTSKITECERPNYFADEMILGAFKNFKHEHRFANIRKVTLMTDYFDYQSPFGIFGKLADRLFLKNYMTKLLTKRNSVIKEFAETEKWKQVLVS